MPMVIHPCRGARTLCHKSQHAVTKPTDSHIEWRATRLKDRSEKMQSTEGLRQILKKLTSSVRLTENESESPSDIISNNGHGREKHTIKDDGGVDKS